MNTHRSISPLASVVGLVLVLSGFATSPARAGGLEALFAPGADLGDAALLTLAAVGDNLDPATSNGFTKVGFKRHRGLRHGYLKDGHGLRGHRFGSHGFAKRRFFRHGFRSYRFGGQGSTRADRCSGARATLRTREQGRAGGDGVEASGACRGDRTRSVRPQCRRGLPGRTPYQSRHGRVGPRLGVHEVLPVDSRAGTRRRGAGCRSRAVAATRGPARCALGVAAPAPEPAACSTDRSIEICLRDQASLP